MQRRGNRPVVYLDQNWLSEITKSQINAGDDQNRSYFSELFTGLNRGITNGTFVCPTSQFHSAESAFIPKLRKPIGEVASRLSCGLSFRRSNDVNHKQLVLAALEWADLGAPSLNWWEIPFNRCPDESPSDANFGGVEESILGDEVTRDKKRLRDGPQTSDYRTFKRARGIVGLSYKDEVGYGLSQLFMELYFGPLIAVAYRNVWQDPSSDEAAMMQLEYYFNGVVSIVKYVELDRVFSHGGGIARFLTSSQFESAPFISILASLRAADTVRYPNRVPEPSLHDDFVMAATVIPYADVLATDNHLAELIKQTRLDTRFDCRVYGMNRKEDFMAELRGM